MPTLPDEYLKLLLVFAPLFSDLIWQHAQVLLLGAILAPGQRTVTAALRIMGLGAHKHFQTYHRVLNRAAWSSWEVSHVLLGLLVQAFAATGTIVCGLDDTIERRRGLQIKARGIYRDPVRSSHSHFVKVSGLRWLSVTPAPPPGACAASSHSLGPAGLGATFSNRPGSVRTFLCRQETRPQEAD
jgi:hypothetical protein